MITLYNDDCNSVLDTMKEHSVDLVIIDPPYEVHADKCGGSMQFKLEKTLNGLKTSNLDKGYNIQDTCEKLIRVMKNINIYIWCNKKQIPEYFKLFIDKYKCKFEILTWHKTNPLPTYSNKYLTDTEFCLYFRKNGYCNPRDTDNAYYNAFTYYLSSSNQKDKKLYNHPTVKPLDFIEKMVVNSSKVGETVLDCFMGTGTTGVACKKLNRNFIGVEIDKDFFNTAKHRIGE